MLKSDTHLNSGPRAGSSAIGKRSRWQQDHLLNLILLFLAFLTYVPFVLVLINSVKDTQQFFTQFWLPVLPFHFENYQKSWPVISQSIMYSLIYSVPTVLLVVAISGLTGYTFARYRFWGREFLFFAILIILMLPGILLVIPMFVQIVAMGWPNTIQAIILPYTAVQIPFGMIVMRAFFETLPREYFEAARLDGAGELQLFYRIAIPLAVPALSTVAIFTLLFSWNDIIWPLVAIFDSNKYPVSIGVLAFNSAFDADFGTTFAAYVLASIPLILVFIVTGRRFMSGLEGGISI